MNLKKLAKFLVNVKKEMKKVKWPDKKTMIENSVATLACILVFGLFFAGLDFVISTVKMVIG
ncbi:preprotein translocase subunit SecE [bacterium]|nr:preprotein translocase subunit SecE [bacterium]